MKKNLYIVAMLLMGIVVASCATPSTTYINNSTHDVVVFTNQLDENDMAIEPVTIAAGESKELALPKPQYDFDFWVRRHPKEEGTVVFVDKPTSDFLFQNNTSFILDISDKNGTDFEPFTIDAQESMLVKSISLDDTYSIATREDTYPHIIEYSIEPGKTIIVNQWIPVIRYEITGTARTVDITYKNSMGETVTLDDVSLPFEKMYKKFPTDIAEISAKNQTNNGTVELSIYKNGELNKTSTTTAPYGNVQARTTVK